MASNDHQDDISAQRIDDANFCTVDTGSLATWIIAIWAVATIVGHDRVDDVRKWFIPVVPPRESVMGSRWRCHGNLGLRGEGQLRYTSGGRGLPVRHGFRPAETQGAAGDRIPPAAAAWTRWERSSDGRCRRGHDDGVH
jgi:hypothetical protein